MRLVTNLRGVLFYGFGGHARSVADVLLSNGVTELLFVDKNARPDETFSKFPVIKQLPSQLPAGWIAFPASGDGLTRKCQLADIKQRGWATGNIISETATISTLAHIGQGCFIGHHSHIGPCANIGDACIVNTGAVIEHDCAIGSYSHVSVNSTIAGKSSIGEVCFIGAGATVIDGIEIGNGVTLGAGGCFIKSTRQPGIYVGTPAKKIK